jgi:hypothetical protein
MTSLELEEEAQRATELLAGKVVRQVWHHRAKELGIEFQDGTRLFVDHQSDHVEISITGGSESPASAERPMTRNVQVIDGARNCVYDVFALSEEDFALLFPDGSDIAFAEDFESRPDLDRVLAALERLWLNRIPKALAMGIHGLLFYELPEKRQFYPTRRDEEATNPDGTGLRR